MKKIVGTHDESLGPAVVYADDVQALFDILRREAAGGSDEVATRILAIGPRSNFLIEPGETDQLPDPPSILNIRVGDVSLRFSVVLGTSVEVPDTALGHGIVAELRKYLDDHCRPWHHSIIAHPAVRWGPTLLAGAMVGESFEHPEVPVWRRVVLCSFFGALSLGFILLRHILERTVIHNVKRRDHETWWKRNGDKIVPPLIVGVVMLVLGTLLGRLLPKSEPSDAAVKHSAPSASAAPPASS